LTPSHPSSAFPFWKVKNCILSAAYSAQSTGPVNKASAVSHWNSESLPSMRRGVSAHPAGEVCEAAR
jgi:hypothetical protein